MTWIDMTWIDMTWIDMTLLLTISVTGLRQLLLRIIILKSSGTLQRKFSRIIRGSDSEASIGAIPRLASQSKSRLSQHQLVSYSSMFPEPRAAHRSSLAVRLPESSHIRR
jgi:hypothetical protein